MMELGNFLATWANPVLIAFMFVGILVGLEEIHK